jgi:hypothetical protein
MIAVCYTKVAGSKHGSKFQYQYFLSFFAVFPKILAGKGFRRLAALLGFVDRL